MSDDGYVLTTVYTLPFVDFYCSSTAGSSYADLWSVKGTTVGRTRIRDISVGQKSTNTAANQQLTVQIQRGTTALGGGSSAAFVNTRSWTGVPTAGSLGYAPSSTSLASTASASVVFGSNSDWSGNFDLPESLQGAYTFDVGQNFVVRVSAPPVGVYLSGTLVIEEVPTKAI